MLLFTFLPDITLSTLDDAGTVRVESTLVHAILLTMIMLACQTTVKCLHEQLLHRPSEQVMGGCSRAILLADRAAWGGGTPPAACATARADTIVIWDKTASPPRCVPDVCGGAKLTDIRDLSGKADGGQICAGPLFDTEHTKACLKDMRVLFLEDSSMHVSERA